MTMTGGWISQIFDAFLNTYANTIGAIIGISLAALVVFLWCRVLQSIARKHSPIEESFFPDS
jgi:hypothetical protein